MKRILFLGGGPSQLPFIKAAAGLAEIIVVDIDPECPGRRYADRFYAESCRDEDRAFEIALDEDVTAALAYTANSYALWAEVAAYGHFGGDYLLRCLNKRRMRDWLDCHGILVPPIAHGTGDFISKPSHGHGSQGVRATNRANDGDLVEQRVTGRELSIGGYVHNGEPMVMAVCEKHVEGFVPRGFTLIDESIPVPAVKALGIDNSFFTIDMIGEYVIDAGVMLDCKVDVLLDHCGANVYEYAVKRRLGIPVEWTPPKRLGSIHFEYDGEPESTADMRGWELT